MPKAVIKIEYLEGRAKLTASHPDQNITSVTWVPLPMDTFNTARAMDFLAQEITELEEKPFGAWTSTQRYRYVRDGGKTCPHCGTDELLKLPGRSICEVLVSCQQCGRAWVDQYKLVEVTPHVEEEP